VREDGALIPVPAPVSGTVLAVNSEVQQNPALLLRSPYERGWLLRLRGRSRAVDLPGLHDGTEAARRAADTLGRIRDEAMVALSGGDSPGVTLPDGGELVPELRRVLGIERYARLLQRTFR
jgi:hypothetical protein